jgi:superfamily I DNA and/or RNA helicase
MQANRCVAQDYAERRALRGELRALQKEERQRQQRAVGEVLARAAVVATTLTGALGRDVRALRYDLAVIDEAAQARPPSYCASR